MRTCTLDRILKLLLACVAWTLRVTLILAAASSPDLRGDNKDAMRVLRDECLSCHKPGKAKGGLLLHSREKMLKGGDNGEVIISGKPAESLLFKALQENGDPHMPPKKQLSENQITSVQQWIESGVGWDDTVFDEPPAPRHVSLSPLPPSFQQVLAVALSPDEKLLAVARANKAVLLDLTQPGRPVAAEMAGHVEPIQSLTWTPDGKQLITGGFQRIIVWDVASHQAIHTLQSSLLGNITALVTDVSGESLFVGDSATGGAGFLHEFDLATGEHRAIWKGHDDTIYTLSRSPQGGRVLSGGADKLVKLWDTVTRKTVAVFEGHTSHVLGVAFNKDGSQIASAGADREIKLWDVKTGEQLISLGDKKEVFTSLAWSGNGLALVAATDRGNVIVYRDFKVHDGAQSSSGTKQVGLSLAKGMVTSIGITADGKTVYGSCLDGTIHSWNGDTGSSTDPPPAK